MSKSIGIGVGMIVIAAIIICFAPLQTVAYTVTVDYQDTETYYEDEPYEVTEAYTETVPVEIEIVEHHLVKEDYPPPASFSMTFIRGKVKNTSNVTLASIDVKIWVKYQVEGLEGSVFDMPGSIDLEPVTFKPGEVRDFEVLLQNGAKEDYAISVSTNTKTTVEKQRTVTKYRQVEKQRTVTKQRPETRYKKVTLLDYLLHY